MAKNGYICKCGWRLNRGRRTRKEYADQKNKHGHECLILANELRQSRLMPQLPQDAEKPFAVGA